MSMAHDLAKLRAEHAKLDVAIAQAYARSHPDLDAIALLKRQKLALKDQITRLDKTANR